MGRGALTSPIPTPFLVIHSDTILPPFCVVQPSDYYLGLVWELDGLSCFGFSSSFFFSRYGSLRGLPFFCFPLKVSPDCGAHHRRLPPSALIICPLVDGFKVPLLFFPFAVLCPKSFPMFIHPPEPCLPTSPILSSIVDLLLLTFPGLFFSVLIGA